MLGGGFNSTLHRRITRRQLCENCEFSQSWVSLKGGEIMANVAKIKELKASKQNKVGLLAEISSAVADAGVNITAICAYVVGANAEFRIAASDNTKATAALKGKGYETTEKNAVKLVLENRVGALKEAGKKLAAANIDLNYIYGTVSDGGPAAIIFSSNNDDKAIEALK